MPSYTTTQLPEPVLLNTYQQFQDLPPIQLRKGVDEEGNPWSPDLMIVSADGMIDAPAKWAMRTFAGKAFSTDFSGEKEVLASLGPSDEFAFWVIRMENKKARRKLLTIRLFAAPAGDEDDPLAWTPIDKFLFEIEGRQQAAVARKIDLTTLWKAWTGRSYFRNLQLPTKWDETSDNPAWIFVAALLTDAEMDHPENVCHCGSVQACNATADGLDRRDPRYPFNQVFKHSIRTTFPLLLPAAMRMFKLG